MQRDSVFYLQGRQQREGVIAQQLSVSMIDTRMATKPVDAQSIRGLAGKLRDATLRTAADSAISLISLGASQGYYFVATDRDHRNASGDDGYRQRVEGVMLRSGYLINFTLLTNDADSGDTKEMISALAQLRIN